MKRVLHAVLVVLIASQSATAAESRPSEASIRELMSLQESRQYYDEAVKRIEASTEASVRRALAGQGVSQKQEEILNEMRVKMDALLKDTINPKTLEPLFIDLYQNAFTQEEIDRALEFYRTEAGKALRTKMPIVVQHVMQIVQSRMTALMPKLQELQRETFEKLRDKQQK